MVEEEGVCAFCRRGDIGEDIVGATLRKDGLVVHQYCLYFSSGLAQKGKEEDGIQGFLLPDIHKEIARGRRGKMKCFVCGQRGGYVGCAEKRCGKAGHFPCLHQNGFLFQYWGSFSAFCTKHCPTQAPLAALSPRRLCCSICVSEVFSVPSFEVLYSPCCLAVLHRSCIQRYALSAGGYFLKCPLCNNTERFIREMLRLGICVPQRDAIWESCGQFNDLYEVSKKCTATQCLCPQGRTYVAKQGKYCFRRCKACGQFVAHTACANSLFVNGTCKDCTLPNSPFSLCAASPKTMAVPGGRSPSVVPSLVLSGVKGITSCSLYCVIAALLQQSPSGSFTFQEIWTGFLRWVNVPVVLHPTLQSRMLSNLQLYFATLVKQFPSKYCICPRKAPEGCLEKLKTGSMHGFAEALVRESVVCVAAPSCDCNCAVCEARHSTLPDDYGSGGDGGDDGDDDNDDDDDDNDDDGDLDGDHHDNEKVCSDPAEMKDLKNLYQKTNLEDEGVKDICAKDAAVQGKDVCAKDAAVQGKDVCAKDAAVQGKVELVPKKLPMLPLKSTLQTSAHIVREVRHLRGGRTYQVDGSRSDERSAHKEVADATPRPTADEQGTLAAVNDRPARKKDDQPGKGDDQPAGKRDDQPARKRDTTTKHTMDNLTPKRQRISSCQSRSNDFEPGLVPQVCLSRTLTYHQVMRAKATSYCQPRIKSTTPTVAC